MSERLVGRDWPALGLVWVRGTAGGGGQGQATPYNVPGGDGLLHCWHNSDTGQDQNDTLMSYVRGKLYYSGI